jgi:hypothetical protein
MLLERSKQQGPITRGRGLGFNPNPTSPEGGVLSPLSFQPDKASAGVTSINLGGISLEGMPEERPRGGGRPLKTFLLLKFEGPSFLGICGGVIGGGGRFCICQAAACDYTSHRTKAWEARPMEVGMYILDEGVMKAYLKPCLPMEDATRSATGKAVLEDGEQRMEAWMAIFCHLREVGTRGNEEVREDPRPQRFATAMKTPQGRGDTNLLNSPNRLRMSGQDNNDSLSITSAGAWDARVAHLVLKHLLALIKGELGSQEVDALYLTVHGGLQGTWDKLRALERGVEGKEDFGLQG